MGKLIFLLLFINSTFYAKTSTDIIKRVEDNLNGKSAYMRISMIVTTKRTKRTVIMESYSKGTKKSFIK